MSKIRFSLLLGFAFLSQQIFALDIFPVKVERAKAYLAAKKARVAQDPVPFNLGPAPGFADYHIHQFTQEAYDGRLYHGDYEGPLEIALRHCANIKHAVSYTFIKAITFFTKFFGKESPYYDWTPHDASAKGYSGSANDFRDWPTWRTYGHVQYWEGWLKQAKDSGLSLVVMSATNSRFLCGFLPFTNDNAKLDFSMHDPLTQIAFSGPSACSDMKNMLRQITVALDFAVRNGSWYEIALTPGDARRIIHQGKLAVILALEGSEMFLNAATPQQVEAQLQAVYDAGVRSIQPVHHIDNQFSGAAQFNGFLKVMDNYWAYKNQVLTALNPTGQNLGEINNISNEWTTAMSTRKLDAEGHNILGLQPLGKELLRQMIQRRMLIDGAHLSEKAFAEAYTVVRDNNWYPIYDSHARLRRLYPDCMFAGEGDPRKCTAETANEMALSDTQIAMIKETGGVVGLRTGPEARLTYLPAGVANNCHGSTRSWVQEYALAVRGYGLTPGFASDMQGGAEQLRPRFYGPNSIWQNTIDNQSISHWACGGHGSHEKVAENQTAQGSRSANGTGTNFDLIGFGHIGYVGAVVSDVQKLMGGTPLVAMQSSSEAYLAMWDRAYKNRTRLNGAIQVSDADIDIHSLADEKCPWPHEKLQVPASIKGRTVCLNKPDTTIQKHNCVNFPPGYGTLCVTEEKEYHVRVRRIVEDICPGIRGKKGLYNGHIACGNNKLPMARRKCETSIISIPATDRDWCLLGFEDGYFYSVQGLVK
jgi:microsomal dipeptidase-like Zn-dependent dipeptidase